MTPELFARGNLRCGEGPLWDEAHARWLWNDLASDLVFEHRGSQTRVLSRDLMVAGIALHRDANTLVFAGASGLHLWREGEPLRTLVTHYEGEDLNFNDILAAPHGGLYAGTVYWGDEMERFWKLYLFEPGGAVRVVDEGIAHANGLALSPDDQTLYFADSATRQILAYDVLPDGDLKNKRVWVQLPLDEGLPDGLTTDSDGFVWCAQWYSGQVVRYDPDGRVERRVPLPVTQVSSVALGGEDGSQMLITTAGDPWKSALAPPAYNWDAPCGGDIYRLRAPTPGKLEHRCAL